MKKNEVIGHEQIIGHMTMAVKTGKISHAYILHGEKGMGKMFLAKHYAKLLQCESPVEEEKEGICYLRGCGVCKSCLQAESGNHPDILYVTHEKASIGVDDIRTQLNADMGIKPYSSQYKIYIIADADRTTEQAQNALLKTIEEPPSYGIVLLLAGNVNRLLSTIRSRCVALPVKTVETNKIRQYLMEELRVPDYLAQMAAEFSGGNIGRAERYALSEDFIQMKEDVLYFLRHMDEMALYEMVETVKKMAQYKTQIKDCIDLMELWFRDMLVIKATNDPNRLLYREEYQVISAQAGKRSYGLVEHALESMDRAKERLDANVNLDTALEMMLDDLSQSEKNTR
ncbi:MAG: DNA polymerase III subunit [Lachnospiraceae bacterium]|jgi:DNA polymerase-3 subunit delta'|nr:DNA polymerase III subunit [Lachnospiraceae bacterium]MCX4315749.1 DNA polymerase III subunit [Lachnospiraceae bacterium]